MVLVNGSWTPNSSTNQRAMLSIDYTITNISDTQCRIAGSVIISAGYSFYDSDNTFSWSGSIVGSGSSAKNVDVAANGKQTIHTFSVVVGRGASNSSGTMAFSIKDINYIGASTVVSVATTVTIPAQPTPTVPTSVSLSRNGNGFNASWGGGAVQLVQISGRPVAGSNTAAWGSWSWWSQANQNSGVFIAANPGYEYRIQVARKNAAGVTSAWAVSNTARVFDKPDTLTSATVLRPSDTSLPVSWVLPTPAAVKPVLGFYIERWCRSLNTRARVATLGSTARNWTDTTSCADDEFQYFVQAYNAAGVSTFVSTGKIKGTPKAAINVAAARVGATDVALTWSPQARYADSQDVQGSSSADNGVTWSSYSNISGHTGLGPTIGTRTITGLNSTVLWKFLVVTKTNVPALSAASKASDVLQLLSPPLAPTPLRPVVVQSSEAPNQEFAWKYNPVDGSQQTAYELYYKLSTAGSYTMVSGTTAQTRTVATLAAGTYLWYVRTKGAHSSWGASSAVASFVVATPPSITITSPAPGTITTNRLTVAWDYNDPQDANMVAWRRKLYDDTGSLIEEVSSNKAATSTTFNYVLPNNTTVTAEIQVTSGTGLKSSIYTVTVTTGFLYPEAPELFGGWLSEQLNVGLNIINATTGELAASNRLERTSDGGGTWQILAENLPVDATFSDLYAPFGKEIQYVAVAVSALGVETRSEPLVLTIIENLVLMLTSTGEIFVLELANNIDTDDSQELVLEEYIGQRYPTPHFGLMLTSKISVTGTLFDGYGLRTDYRKLLGKRIYYRDMLGNNCWTVLESKTRSQGSTTRAELSLQFTVVEDGDLL